MINKYHKLEEIVNKERFAMFVEEFFISKIKDSYFFVTKEGEEHVFVMNNGLQISIKDPNREK